MGINEIACIIYGVVDWLKEKYCGFVNVCGCEWVNLKNCYILGVILGINILKERPLFACGLISWIYNFRPMNREISLDSYGIINNSSPHITFFSLMHLMIFYNLSRSNDHEHKLTIWIYCLNVKRNKLKLIQS